MFVGNGFDIHKHSKGENLILGGIRVDGDGFEAHSDGDIVLHSLCDALLGSKAKKDLNWKPKISFNELVTNMVEHDLENVNKL